MQQEQNELISATPSATDLKLGEWIIRGVAGFTTRTVVDAASNSRTCEVVAVKILARYNAYMAQKVEREVRLYEALKTIGAHKHARFVMLMHSVIYKTDQEWHGSPDEVFLFVIPLGTTTFHDVAGWASQDHQTKLVLFCQICLGILAVHDMGWIHRDVKPENLYVVTFDPPRAVVGDFDCATRKESDLTPRPGQVGTIGWLAPELEDSQIVPQYSAAVDIWSLGAVGFHLFLSPRRPWVSNQQYNTFMHKDDPAFGAFLALVHELSQRAPNSLEHLIGQMLSYSPNERPVMYSVLGHHALVDILRVYGV